MKQTLHPKYHTDAVVSCACGNKVVTGSTKPTLEVAVCSNCHPFYTGAQTFVDTQGRIEQFRAKQKGAKTSAKKTRVIEAPQLASKSLKEMLQTK